MPLAAVRGSAVTKIVTFVRNGAARAENGPRPGRPFSARLSTRELIPMIAPRHPYKKIAPGRPYDILKYAVALILDYSQLDWESMGRSGFPFSRE